MTVWGLIGLILLYRENKQEVLLFISTFLTLLLIYSKWWGLSGGDCFGPRYLIEVLPCLTIPIGKAIDKLSIHLLFKVGFLISSLISFFHSAVGVYTNKTVLYTIENPIYEHNIPFLIRYGPINSWIYQKSFVTGVILLIGMAGILFVLAKNLISEREGCGETSLGDVVPRIDIKSAKVDLLILEFGLTFIGLLTIFFLKLSRILSTGSGPEYPFWIPKDGEIVMLVTRNIQQMTDMSLVGGLLIIILGLAFWTSILQKRGS